MTRRIYLCKGRYALIDDDDAALVSRMDWYLVHGNRTHYASTGSSIVGKTQRAMHRLVMRAVPGQVVDHINGDGLDNRKANLRFVTAKQNANNRFEHDRFNLHSEGRIAPTPVQLPNPFDGLKQGARQRRLGRFRRAHKRAAELAAR